MRAHPCPTIEEEKASVCDGNSTHEGSIARRDVNFNRIIDRYMEVGYARSVIRLMLFSTRHFIFHLSRQINCIQSELGKKFCIFDAFRFEGSSRHLDTETDKNDHLFGAST